MPMLENSLKDGVFEKDSQKMADFKNCKLWCTLQLLYSISFISKPGICSRLSQGSGFLSSKASYEENNKMNFFLKLSSKM